MQIQLLLFPLLLMVSAGAQACGTLENWMDAYEGIESGNEWRDSMNQLETLVMMSGCGASNLDKQQVRLSHILLQSLKQKGRLMAMPSARYEIRDKLKQVRSPLAFDSLIETIYRRFSCLSDTPEALPLREHFGTRFCPGGEQYLMSINAASGGLARTTPGGRQVTSFKNGTEVRILGQSGEWYRITLPRNTYIPGEPSIAYVHESILVE